MKRLLLMISLLCGSNWLFAQYVYTINADSVKITNHCDTAELIIENHTQDVPGFLFNKGRGRTEFRRALQKINDSMYLAGGDTLKISDPNAERSLVFSSGLTRAGNLITNNLSTGVNGGQTITGSTAANSGITYKATSAVGSTGADHVFTVGNNGATEALRILNNGQITVSNGPYGSHLAPPYSFAGELTTGISNDPDGVKITKSGSLAFEARASEVFSYKRFLPATDGDLDLGQFDKRWNNFYVNHFFLPDGSAAIPAYDFIDDQGHNRSNGMFSGGTQFLGFSVGGSEKMRIDSFGSISIGTTDASGKLNITGSNRWSANALTGAVLNVQGGVIKDITTGTSGTQAQVVVNSFGQPAYRAASTGVTHALGATVFIAGAPIADSNVTITQPLSLYIGSGNSRMNGALAVYHLANANTATPSIAGGTGAGASPSVAVTGSDIAGKISITTGISPSGSNTTIATVTFNVPYTASPYVILTPADGTTALLSGTTMVYIGAATSTGFVLTSGTAALAASTSYSFYYHVIQ